MKSREQGKHHIQLPKPESCIIIYTSIFSVYNTCACDAGTYNIVEISAYGITSVDLHEADFND